MLLAKLQSNLMVLILLIIIYAHSCVRLKGHGKAELTLKHAITIDSILLLLELLSTYFNGNDMLQYYKIHKAVIMSIFFLIPIMTIFAPAFTIAWINKTTKIKIHFPQCLYVPIIANTVLTVLTIWTKWLGYIDENNEYVRGEAFIYVIIMVAFYMGYTVYLLLKYRSKMQRGHFEVGVGVVGIIVIAITIQITVQDVLTIWSTMGILCVCGYVFTIYYDLIHDVLTGLENRASYLNYTKILEAKKEIRLSAISIDLDGFKEINDTYGHYEGDQALVQFSKLLQEGITGKRKIIRMGGDEFIIFIEEDNIQMLKEQIVHLKECMQKYNVESNKEYTLDFSYGVAVYDKHFKSIQEFLNDIDRRMYSQKNRKRYKSNRAKKISRK